MLKAPIASHDMADHFGQLHLGSFQPSLSLAKQSFCRPTFNRVGRVSATTSPASPSYLMLQQQDLSNCLDGSPPSTPGQGDLLKPEPNHDRLGPRLDLGDPSTHRHYNQQQQQQQSSTSGPGRPTFTRICGPRTPRQQAPTFPSLTPLLSPSPSPSLLMPLDSPDTSDSRCGLVGGRAVSTSCCSSSLSRPLSLSPSPTAAQPSSGWYALPSLPLISPPSSLVEPSANPCTLSITVTAPSPTGAPEGEPGTREGCPLSSATVSAPNEACPASPPMSLLSAGGKGSTPSFHKRPAFHRDRFPSPPPALYPTYSCLTLKNSGNHSGASSTASSSRLSATRLSSATTWHGDSSSDGYDSDSALSTPQDFLIEADLPYPVPATLQERQARQRKRAEQLRQLKVREEREARDRRRSMSGARRRGSSLSLSLAPPSPTLAKMPSRGCLSARTPKVAFDLRRTKVFEYDATGNDWDTLTIRTVPESPACLASPISPASLSLLFSPSQSCSSSSPSMAMDEDSAGGSKSSDYFSLQTVSQSVESKTASTTPPPTIDVEMEMTT